MRMTFLHAVLPCVVELFKYIISDTEVENTKKEEILKAPQCGRAHFKCFLPLVENHGRTNEDKEVPLRTNAHISVLSDLRSLEARRKKYD